MSSRYYECLLFMALIFSFSVSAMQVGSPVESVESTAVVHIPRFITTPITWLEIFHALTPKWRHNHVPVICDVVYYMIEYLAKEDARNFLCFAYSNIAGIKDNSASLASQHLAQFRKEATKVLSVFDPDQTPRVLRLESKIRVAFGILSLLAAGSSLAWAVYEDSILSWEIFTVLGIIFAWPALILPYHTYSLYYPNEFENSWIKMLFWLTSNKGKYTLDKL